MVLMMLMMLMVLLMITLNINYVAVVVECLFHWLFAVAESIGLFH